MGSFAIQRRDRELIVKLTSKTLADAVGRFEFCSRLLHSLAPTEDGTWTNSKSLRVSAHIVGFPRSLTWERPDASTLVASSLGPIDDEYVGDLTAALKGICGSASNGSAKQFSFRILDESCDKSYTYVFTGRGREISSFCVLWDLVEHPRDHLEVWRDPSVTYLGSYPFDRATTRVKTYGDPSKTIDALRNQGFPRATDQSPRGTSIQIRKLNRYGSRQEHYKLLTREQQFEDQVGRSQISRRIRLALYESSDFRCANCGQRFDTSNLVPDHRIPSIVQKDNLSDSNYLQVLQTFCIRCNQVKREACKKCPYEHNCSHCAWAFPEKFGLSTNSIDLIRKAAKEANFDGELNKFIKWLLS